MDESLKIGTTNQTVVRLQELTEQDHTLNPISIPLSSEELQKWQQIQSNQN